MASQPSPFYAAIPKDPIENLKWRAAMRRAAMDSVGVRTRMRQAAFDDVLFFFAAFGWVFEPRSHWPVKPFVPWSHQEPVILEMDEAIDEALATEQAVDVLLDKSRAQGGTYIYLNICLRRWLRDPMFSAGLVTRNEKLVDSATDSDTLLFKVAWAIERLPKWMLPEGFDLNRHRSLSDHSFLNPANGATIVGYAAGQDVGRGGRKTMFVCDEIGAVDFVRGGKDVAVMDALHDVTNVIFLVSTFGCDAGVFWEAATSPEAGGKHLVLDWKDNPVQNRLAFVLREGLPAAVRPEEQAEVETWVRANRKKLKAMDRRGYVTEGKTLSPWYIMRCLRKTATPRLIAKELDRNPRGAVGKVFSTELLDRMKRDSCKPPVWQGTPVFDSETLAIRGLLPREDGPLKLWFRPGPDNSCPLGPFTVGCDMAAGADGVYSSNSVASGIDDRTGEQVMEYAIKGMPLIKFGRVVVGLCLWLRKALLGWEDSGMASPFAKEIMEVLYYGNVFYRDVPEIGSKRASRKAGWGNHRNEDKAELFERLELAMQMQAYTARSEDLILECGQYEWDKGKIVHAPTKNRGATETNHGDRCIAAGVAYLVYSDKTEGNRLDTSGGELDIEPEYGSFLWCEMQERRRVEPDSPEWGLKDVVSL